MQARGFWRCVIALVATVAFVACGDLGPNTDDDRGLSQNSTAVALTGGYGGMANLSSSTSKRRTMATGTGGALGVAGAHLRAAVSLDENDPFEAPSYNFTVVPYYAEIYDDYDNYDLYEKRYRSFTRESIQICASLASFTSDFELDVFVNGQRENALAVASMGIAQGCRTILVNAGDYVDVRVYQESGSSLTFPRNQYWNWMTIERVFLAASAENNPTVGASQYTFTPIPFSDELFDLSGTFDPQSGSFTTRFGTYPYQFCASVASFGVDFELDLFTNGTRERGFAVAAHGAANGCRVLLVQPDTPVDVRVYQALTPSMTVPPNAHWNWLTVNLVYLHDSLGDISTFTAPTDWFTTVPFSAALFSRSGEYNPATGRFTAAAGEEYQFCASVTSFGQIFEVDLFINGYRENAFARSRYGTATGCRTIRMRANDFVEVKVHHSTGAPVTFAANGIWNWLTVHRVQYLW